MILLEVFADQANPQSRAEVLTSWLLEIYDQ